MTPALTITGDYGDTWPAISHATKEAAGWRCVRCRHPFDPETGRALECRDPFGMPLHRATVQFVTGDPVLWGCDERRCQHKAIVARAEAARVQVEKGFTQRGHRDPTLWHNYGVHHFDGNKSNTAWWNLMALCNSCHLYVQASVIPERLFMFHHSAWMIPYVCGYYAHDRRGLGITREEALATPDKFLAMGQPWLYADTEHNQPVPL